MRMRKLNSLMLALVLLALALPAVAATPSEFYINLLRRGVADVEAGEFARATGPLRLAAFGLVDSIEHYQTAQVCLAVAWQKQEKTEAARDAARRVVSAQRVERRYIALSISPSIRSQFESIAPQLLTSEEFALLHSRLMAPPQSAATAAPAPQQPTIAVTAPRQTAAAIETKAPATASTGTRAQQAPPAAAPQSTVPAPQTAVPSTQSTATNTPNRPAIEQISEAAAGPASESLKPAPAKAPPAVASNPPAKGSVPPPAASTTSVPQGSAIEPEPSTTVPPQSQPTQTVSLPPAPAAPARTPAAAPAPAKAAPRGDVSAQLATAAVAVDKAQLPEAKRIYHEILKLPELSRDALVKVAEGLYRVRDFAGSLEAFTRLGALKRGEEPYRYYVAVVLYETGQYAKAKAELAAALPFIEVTDDVARYRAKIEGVAR